MLKSHSFEISTQLSYNATQPGWILVNVAAMRAPGQKIVSENFHAENATDFSELKGEPGTSRFHRVTCQGGPVTISYQARVERDSFQSDAHPQMQETRLVDLRASVIPFLFPSRYCESDKLASFTSQEFGAIPPGHERVAGICNWIYNNITYQPGSTDEHSSVVDCMISRAGVCRDFAHLGVAFCRALGIPARYGSVYAYALQPPDFHAIFEVWLGNRWWFYDATRLAPQEGFILVGRGKDAAESSVAILSPGILFQSMSINVTNLREGSVNYVDGHASFAPNPEHEA